MTNSPLEFLAKKYGNVVKYDKEGNVAGIFVRFDKRKSSDLVAGLPEHTHPAFIINGVEQDYILLGKYKAGTAGASDGRLLSLPNIPPVASMGADQLMAGMKKAGPGITGMTVADAGFIKLLAQKEGWTPHGNNDWGSDYRDGSSWTNGQSVSKDTIRTFEGFLYTCLIAHTCAAELRPDIAPNYWKKGKQVGGTSYEPSGAKDGGKQTGYKTLNGSGPLDWYLGSDPGNMSDLIGSSLELNAGYRIVDGEIQILENNNAADPDADLSASSAAWKAILPNKANDGYSLVTPGTSGTLHWNFLNDKITLDTQCDNFTKGGVWQSFAGLVANTSHLPYVPSIMKELGLFPTGSDDKTQGGYGINFTKGEFFPRRGGFCSHTSNAGLGCVNAYDPRGCASTYFGSRPRSLA